MASKKMNLENIMADFSAVENLSGEINTTLSHNENVLVKFIFPSPDNPYNASDNEDDLKNLSLNIEANGLLHPLVLNKKSRDEYIIISGERRFKAITTFLNWSAIPCTVYDNLPDETAQLKLHAANLETREYTAAQKLQFYIEVKKLIEKMKESGQIIGSSKKGIAELMGVSEVQVRKYQKITNELSDSEINKIKAGDMSINEAYTLARENEGFKSPAQETEKNATPQKSIEDLIEKSFSTMIKKIEKHKGNCNIQKLKEILFDLLSELENTEGE